MSFEKFGIKEHFVTHITGMSLFMDIYHVFPVRIVLLHEFVAYWALKLWIRTAVVSGHVLLDFTLAGKLFAAYFATEQQHLFDIFPVDSNAVGFLVSIVIVFLNFGPTMLACDLCIKCHFVLMTLCCLMPVPLLAG